MAASIPRAKIRAVPLPAILRATHPVPAAAVTVLAGAALAARGAGPETVAIATASTLAGQLSVGWSNDYLDRHEDAGRMDKPIPAGNISPVAVWWAATVAFPACLVLSAPLGLAEVSVMAAAVASAWAYNLGLQRTILSWAPYAVSFGLAPVYLWLAADDGLPEGWVVAGAALLGVAGHLTNVLPDLEADRAHGSRGIPHRLGPSATLLLAALCLAATLVLVVTFGPRVGPGAVTAATLAAVLILAVVVVGASGRSRPAFLLTIAAAGAVVAAFLLAGPR
jgi:4-hydroxybenzoate polyprenyltransferase